MTRVFFLLFAGATLAGCAELPLGLGQSANNPPTQTETPAQTDETVPESETETLTVEAPPANARTVEQFDTTSEEERAAAVVEAQSVDAVKDLGMTIASLGSPSDPGIWLKTPLVTSPAKGRVEYPEKGTSVAVNLFPIGGDTGSGSRMSLAAMRLIEADLTGLPEIRVFLLSN